MSEIRCVTDDRIPYQMRDVPAIRPIPVQGAQSLQGIIICGRRSGVFVSDQLLLPGCRVRLLKCKYISLKRISAPALVAEVGERGRETERQTYTHTHTHTHTHTQGEGERTTRETQRERQSEVKCIGSGERTEEERETYRGRCSALGAGTVQ